MHLPSRYGVRNQRVDRDGHSWREPVPDPEKPVSFSHRDCESFGGGRAAWRRIALMQRQPRKTYRAALA